MKRTQLSMGVLIQLFKNIRLLRGIADWSAPSCSCLRRSAGVARLWCYALNCRPTSIRRLADDAAASTFCLVVWQYCQRPDALKCWRRFVVRSALDSACTRTCSFIALAVSSSMPCAHGFCLLVSICTSREHDEVAARPSDGALVMKKGLRSHPQGPAFKSGRVAQLAEQLTLNQ